MRALIFVGVVMGAWALLLLGIVALGKWFGILMLVVTLWLFACAIAPDDDKAAIESYEERRL